VKRIAACILFVLLALALSAPTAAHGSTKYEHPKAQNTKAQKKAQKQWKKQSKQQAKAQKKQLKGQRKGAKKSNKNHRTTTVT
jgi:biopolymer transport protein ExbD